MGYEHIKSLNLDESANKERVEQKVEKVFANYEVKSKGANFRNHLHMYLDDNIINNKDATAAFPLTFNKQIIDVNKKRKISKQKGNKKKVYSLILNIIHETACIRVLTVFHSSYRTNPF